MDVVLLDLWLPMLAAAVVVFFASFAAHMVLKHHKGDWSKLPNEDAFLDMMRAAKAPAGQYMFPHCCDYKEMQNPEMKKKLEAGPMGTMTIWPGNVSMGRNLALTFATYLLITLFVAYLASVALHRGEDFLAVFRFTATAGVMGHCFGFFGHSIWYGQSRRAFINDLIDGAAYGLLTGVVFGLLWPASSVTLPV